MAESRCVLSAQWIAKLISEAAHFMFVADSETPNTLIHPTLTLPNMHWDCSSHRGSAVDGRCHASPLKPEYEGSVCLSGRVTLG